MKVIKIDNTKITECEYPNADISQPVAGLNMVKVDGKLLKDESNHIQYYYIIENQIKNTEPLAQESVRQPVRLTDEIHPEYKHLCLAYYDYVLTDIPDVIKNLNEYLGNYLDSEYPIATRIKHAVELTLNAFVVDAERMEDIFKLNNWLNTCREIRDQRENDYLNKNIFPEFNNYPQKPQKP